MENVVPELGEFVLTIDSSKDANDIRAKLNQVDRDLYWKFGVEMVILDMQRDTERNLHVTFGLQYA